MDREDINRAIQIADTIIEEDGKNVARQVASSLFQRTLEVKSKNKWLSSEDDLIRTFFYLSSKEELCETLQCDMQSLYARARTLGVVSPSFGTLTAVDLTMASELFAMGISQEEVLALFGIKSISVPVQSLNMNDYTAIRDYINKGTPKQMGLFDDEDKD